jgi:hypothetical protein
MIRRLALLVLLLAVPASSEAQDACLENAQGFDQWLNCRVERAVAAAAGPGGAEKQAEAPSLADDSPTLVDSTSAPDFVGFGLTLLGLRDGEAGDSDATTGGTAITATAYSLLAAAYGKDPLADRDFYYDNANWRRFSFTLGRMPARDDGLALNSEATIVGAKIVLLNLREIARDENFTLVQEALSQANVSFAGIASAVQGLLAAAFSSDSPVAFAASSLGSKTFKATLEKVDEDLSRKIDAAILARIGAELAMREAIAEKITEVKTRPQISAAWSSNLRDASAPDQHRFEGIVDIGMAPRLSFTANAGVDFVAWKNLPQPPDAATTVGRAAASLSLALGRAGNTIVLEEPVTLSLALDLQWKNSDTDYRAQLKLDFPVAGGITIPVSLTWADRADAIEEKEIRGLFGFTIDTSKLAAALR